MGEFLSALMAQTGTQREMQTRRDAWLLYQQHQAAWLDGTAKAWRDAVLPASSAGPGGRAVNLSFELLSDDVVENKIVASRMALTVAEQVSQQFDSLRQRTQVLEGQDMDSTDILRAETICLKLVEQWWKQACPRTDLLRVIDPLQRELANQVQKHHQAVNVFMWNRAWLRPRTCATVFAEPPQGLRAPRPWGTDPIAWLALRQAVVNPAAPHNPWVAPSHGCLGRIPRWRVVVWRRHRHDSFDPCPATGAGRMGQLRRLLSQPVTGFDMTQAPPASAALAHALSAQRVQAETHYSGMVTIAEDYSPAAVVQVAGRCASVPPS